MLCSDFEAPYLLIFSKSIESTLIYYSHIPAALTAILVGIYVYLKSKDNHVSASYLLAMTVAFFLWALGSLVTWTNIDSRIIMFFWSLFSPLLALIYFFGFHFHYSFIKGADSSTGLKLLTFFLIAPVLLLYSSPINLNGFDLVFCESSEAQLFNYYYHVLGFLFSGWIIFNGIKEINRKKESSEKNKILLLTLGLALFLLSFIGNSFLGSYTDNYLIEQYELFSVIIFMIFLGYIVVRYKAFDIKMIGAQALIISLVIILGSQFFYVRSTTNTILNGIALLLTLIAGYFLIRSVKKEVERKEELQKISDSLAAANERLKELDNAKSEFISIASHQLRTPLTAIKGYVSLILEGSYGQVPVAIQDILNKVYSVNERLAHLVEDLLNVSRIEAGRIQYNFEPTYIESLVADLVDSFRVTPKAKHLDFRLLLPEHSMPKLLIDPNKIKEVVSNLIDNALKYTKAGSVVVSVEALKDKARISIKDTGIGIKPEEREHLFEKFVRSKETTRMVVNGAGLGLFVGRNFIAAHGGKIWAESEGPGKGSTFIIELPFVNPNVKAGKSEQPAVAKTG